MTGHERCSAPSALAPAGPGRSGSADWAPRPLAVGDGAVEFRAVLERSGASIPDDDSELHRVSARTTAGSRQPVRRGDPDEVQPEYLRLPDAEISRRAAPDR